MKTKEEHSPSPNVDGFTVFYTESVKNRKSVKAFVFLQPFCTFGDIFDVRAARRQNRYEFRRADLGIQLQQRSFHLLQDNS